MQPPDLDLVAAEVRAAASLDELFAAARPLGPSVLRDRQVAMISRALDRLATDRGMRIAFLATHTLEPLPDYVRARCATLGIEVRSYVGPFNQIAQELLAPHSGLKQFQPELIIISAAIRELAPQVALEFATLDPEQLRHERTRLVRLLADWADAAVNGTSALVLVSNFARPPHPAYGVADSKQVLSEAEFYWSLNLQLLEALKPLARAHLLDLDRLMSAYGTERAHSSKLYHLAKMPWSQEFIGTLATEISRHVIAARGLARKALVLDLDNTLWGGVAGEDGPAGIRVGPGDPSGEAYDSFQRALRNLQARGVLLAIASKNNPDDVDEVFAQRTDMPLKAADFAARSVGWHDKGQSLRKLAEQLNIGLDSFVFADDNPVERAIVRGSAPEVLVLDLPRDPAELVAYLQASVWFERLEVTEEDRGKTQQYLTQARRSDLMSAAVDLGGYLRDLETRLVLRRARPADVPRAHQLFVKTNQFNVTTRRYDVGDVERFIHDPRYRLVLASMSDRFGDLGIIGLYLLELRGEDIVVDSFIMSCRALGRDAESAIMNHLKAAATACADARWLRATFIPTRKNAPARDFFERQHLSIERAFENGTKEYCIALGDSRPVSVEHIAVVEPEEAA